MAEKSFYVFHHGVQPGGARHNFAHAFGTFAEVKLVIDFFLWGEVRNFWQDIQFLAYIDGKKVQDIDLLPLLTGDGPNGVSFGLIHSPVGFKVVGADQVAVENEEFLSETIYRLDWSSVQVPELPASRLEAGERGKVEPLYSEEEDLEWGVNDLENGDLSGSEFLAEYVIPGAAVNLAWLTHTVVSLARSIDASKDHSALPILADALEDAGCDHDFFLHHCRAPITAHVQGHADWLPKLLVRAADGKGPWLT